MKKIFIIFILPLFISCKGETEGQSSMQAKIDSLETALRHVYKPGLGEFMSSIQVHHAKLWFAGQHKNWELAAFEINEIGEAIDGIREYCTDRPEAAYVKMIEPALDSLSIVIKDNNSAEFSNRYQLLTAACNNCHRETMHSFNIIKVPGTPPFSNQDFEAPVKEPKKK